MTMMLLNCEFGIGSVLLYSTGAVEVLYVSDPGMVKDMSHCTSSELGKPIYIQKSRKPLFGDGILVSNGDIWAYQRKVIAPEFFMEKINVTSASSCLNMS